MSWRAREAMAVLRGGLLRGLACRSHEVRGRRSFIRALRALLPGLGLAAVLACGAATALAAGRYQIRDQAGHVTAFTSAPRRVVSLLPSLTETICALGACDRLVGVDRYSDWPPEVRHLPQLGGGLDPSVEAVVALQPDVVLIGTSSPSAGRLRSLGLKVVALQPSNIETMRKATGLLGELLEVGTAPGLLRRIDAGVDAAAQSIPPAERGQRVYFEVSSAPYAAGRSSFIGELLHVLGLDDIAGPELGPFPKLTPEFIVRSAPQVIIVSREDAPALAQRPGWDRMAAVREGRICRFTAAERNILVRPGPRMPEAARWIADCIRGLGAPRDG